MRAWSLLYVVASSLAILSMFACLLAILFVLGKQLWGTFRPRQTCRPLVASVCCCQQKEKCTLTCQDRHRRHRISIINITTIIIIILLPAKREMHDLSRSTGVAHPLLLSLSLSPIYISPRRGCQTFPRDELEGGFILCLEGPRTFKMALWNRWQKADIRKSVDLL